MLVMNAMLPEELKIMSIKCFFFIHTLCAEITSDSFIILCAVDGDIPKMAV